MSFIALLQEAPSLIYLRVDIKSQISSLFEQKYLVELDHLALAQKIVSVLPSVQQIDLVVLGKTLGTFFVDESHKITVSDILS